MRTSLVVTVIGEDRPGIVEAVSAHVVAAGANWEESRMARLAGKFAGLLRISVDADRADDLAAALRTLTTGGLTIVAERGGDAAAQTLRTFHLDLLGDDHPGIVRDIAHALARHGVNIEELETDVTNAPMTGDPLFRARARLAIPSSANMDDLRRTLETLANDLMVDVTLGEGDQV